MIYKCSWIQEIDLFLRYMTKKSTTQIHLSIIVNLPSRFSCNLEKETWDFEEMNLIFKLMVQLG